MQKAYLNVYLTRATRHVLRPLSPQNPSVPEEYTPVTPSALN